MSTLTVWLLLTFVGSRYGDQPRLIERFATVAECQRVLAVIDSSTERTVRSRCVQATVIKP